MKPSHLVMEATFERFPYERFNTKATFVRNSVKPRANGQIWFACLDAMRISCLCLLRCVACMWCSNTTWNMAMAECEPA